MNVLILISCLGLLSLFVGLSDSLRRYSLQVIVAGVLALFVLNFFNWNQENTRYYHDMVNFDHYAVAFTGVILFVAALVFMLSKDQFNFDEKGTGDYYGIMAFTVAGAIMMVSYSNLAMLFIGIEALSVSLYTLAGSKKTSHESNEAALKYFILGAFATGFLLFGITMIYGATGSFNLAEIAAYVNGSKDLPYLFYAGLLMLMVGLLFKVSAAPFHFWAPDVYEGSPNIVTSFMATVVKIAAFAAFYRLFSTCFGGASEQWEMILSAVVVLTLVIGNFSALAQSNLKRLLAYSGIANAGFMLLAIVALKGDAASALFYYSIAYAAASLGAFAVLILLSEEGQTLSIDSLRGLGKKNPVVAVLFCIVLLSMAGIPPTAGFFAKYFIISTAIANGHLAVSLIAILTSLVGIYYYFKIIATLFSAPVEGSENTIAEKKSYILILCAVIIIAAGILPELIISLLR
ncbi:MAG: NADH-quinone oxidoreductase subunit N [Bacteroidetes bacterium]|nr:NADH-quinone oxidoreductase subunit N [Bacteroidota bacterium]